MYILHHFSGLLVSYCHGFDLKVGSGRIYFISTVIGEFSMVVDGKNDF